MLHKAVAKVQKPAQPATQIRRPAAPSAFNTKTFHKGEIIFKEGAPATVAYLIKKGIVQIFKIIDNKRQVLAELTPGQIFGEMGVINNEPRMAGAMALDFCELVAIDENTINMTLKQSPPVISSLTKLLIQRIRVQAQKLYAKEQQGTDIFIITCAVLEIMNKNSDRVLHSDLSAKLKDIVAATQLDVDNAIMQLFKLNLVQVEKAKNKINSVKIQDPANFMSTAKGFYDNWNKDKEKPQLEFLDLYDFAKLVKSEPNIIYKKIAEEEIPPNLFFFHQQGITDWVKEVGEEFFQKAKKKRKKIEEIDSIEDIVVVDSATLQKAFSEIGINKVGMLYVKASEEAKKRIMGNLGAKMRTVIEEEYPEDKEIDEIEVDEAEEELIRKIKIIKGVIKEAGSEPASTAEEKKTAAE